MPEPIDGAYFNWLRAKVVDLETPSYLYLELLRLLYRTEFVWTLIGDKNRADDGIELREAFLRETRYINDFYWFESPCSVLEVFIAFAKRACFETDMPVKDWFWIFITNLGLDRYKEVSNSDTRTINRILETFIFRVYDDSGYGGLFPLQEPDEDQTKLELWFQFNRYIYDQGLV